ncbi:hypothetical protein AAE478_007365 [Parahypoxylon ruwenzoriense]
MFLRLLSLAWNFNYGQLRQYYALVMGMIKARVSRDEKVLHDLYSIVADAVDTNVLSPEDLWSEAIFLIPAGADTVSACLCPLFFYLSRNPESYQKLADEVRFTFTSGAEIRQGPKLASCDYIQACVIEALRIIPPVSIVLWRELLTTNGGTTYR